MIFLTKTDIQQRIKAGILAQITGGDDTLLDHAETQAIGVITDMLSEMYDISTELAKTGTDRHAALKMWLVSLACYYLYAYIPDTEIPERIIKDYDDTNSMLSKIALGKMPTTLTPIQTDDGDDKRVFRYGFNNKRSHAIL